MSVQIVEYKEHRKSNGNPFYSLVLEGEIEMVQSKESGRFYATAKRASIASTFSLERCIDLVGTKMPGTIVKVECEEYEYTLPDSGEVITLSHRYEYRPEGSESTEMEDAIFERDNGQLNPELA